MRLPHFMVRILPQDHHFDILSLRVPERLKNLILRRKHRSPRVLLSHEIAEFAIVRLGELRPHQTDPILRDHCHSGTSRTLTPRSFKYLLTSLISSSL